MWTRMELKMRAKEAFRHNYWSCVVVALVMSIITGAASNANSGEQTETAAEASGSAEAMALAVSIAAIATIVMIVASVFKIILGNALLVGGSRFFVLNQVEKAGAGTLGFAFKSGSFGNVVLVMFLKDLYTVLWMFLFIIPGIIKEYEYKMVPYILAENPQMNHKEVFKISKQMMMGHKWDAFMLDLSFVGWRILEGITLGLAGVFYVEPYYQATIAEMYVANRTIAYQNGYIG